MFKPVAAALVLAVLAPAAFAQGKPVMKPGLWEIVMVNETPGSPVKRTITARACYSADDVASLPRVLPQQREFGMKCDLRDPKAQGTSATWHVACTGKDGSMSGPAKMSMGPDSYTAEADLELKKPGAKPVKVAQKVSGKWLEACK
jgi:hypothetical protein